MASFIRESILGQCLRPILNHSSWLQYDEESSAPEQGGHSDHGHDNEKPILVDWHSAEDQENPHNWPSFKKAFVAFVIGIYSFVVYMAAPIYVPGENAFRDEFGVNAAEGSLGLALYVYTSVFLASQSQYTNRIVLCCRLGYGFGPLFFSPLSEVPRIGRNLPYAVSFILFCIISIPTALSPTSVGFYVLRFLQGFFGSPCLATGGASIADVYPETSNALPYAMATWVLCIFCAPAIGTVVSGFAIPVLGWRFSIWEILIVAGPVLVLLLLLPETGHGTILYRRARRLEKQNESATGRKRVYQSAAEVAQNELSFHSVVRESLLIPSKITLLDPAILFLNAYTSLTYGIYYSFFEDFPIVFQGIYGFNLGEMGLVFLAIVIGSLISFSIYSFYIHKTQNPPDSKEARTDPPKKSPESVLIPALFACFGPSIGLFLFGWAARPEIHWVVPTLGIVIYPACVYILMQCVFLYIPACYPRYAASVFAATDFTRSAFACGAVVFSRPLYENLGVGRGCSLLAGLTVGCVVGIYLLFWYGEALRRKSRFVAKW